MKFAPFNETVLWEFMDGQGVVSSHFLPRLVTVHGHIGFTETILDPCQSIHFQKSRKLVKVYKTAQNCRNLIN